MIPICVCNSRKRRQWHTERSTKYISIPSGTKVQHIRAVKCPACQENDAAASAAIPFHLLARLSSLFSATAEFFSQFPLLILQRHLLPNGASLDTGKERKEEEATASTAQE